MTRLKPPPVSRRLSRVFTPIDGVAVRALTIVAISVMFSATVHAAPPYKQARRAIAQKKKALATTKARKALLTRAERIEKDACKFSAGGPKLQKTFERTCWIENPPQKTCAKLVKQIAAHDKRVESKRQRLKKLYKKAFDAFGGDIDAFSGFLNSVSDCWCAKPHGSGTCRR